MYLPVLCALFLTNAQTIHNALTLKEYEVRPVKYELMRTQNETLEVITAINKQLGSVCRSRFPERTWSDHNFDKVISDLWSWPPSHSWGWNKIPTCSSLIFYVCTKQLYMYGISIRLATKPRDLILTNILEEGSSVDEPRSFEQDEQYLDECLKVLDGNPEQLQVNVMISSIIISIVIIQLNIRTWGYIDFKTITFLICYYNLWKQHIKFAQFCSRIIDRNK